MTDEQIETLRKSINGIDMKTCTNEEKEILRFLIARGYCEKPISLNQTVIYASQAGKAFIHLQNEMVKKHSQEEADKRFDRKLKVFNAIIPIITFILGILVEHFSGVLKLALSIFH